MLCPPLQAGAHKEIGMDIAEKIYFTTEAEDVGARVDRALADRLEDYSRSAIQRLIEEGRVLLDGAAVKARYVLRPGDRIEILTPPVRDLSLEPQDIPLDIVYEDEHIVVINKPAGMVTHPAPGHPGGTLVNALLHHCQDLAGIGGARRPGIVHRIDKDTTGLLVVAKNDHAHQSLSDQIASREMKRTYLVLVAGMFEENEGAIEAPIGRHRQDRKRMAICADGRFARTHWTVAQRAHGLTLLRVDLDTGRSHQIRVHLKHIGRPVVGDPDYGLADKQILQAVPDKAVGLSRLIKKAHRQMLHAAVLRLTHPHTGESMRFEAPLPADFQALVDHLSEAG